MVAASVTDRNTATANATTITVPIPGTKVTGELVVIGLMANDATTVWSETGSTWTIAHGASGDNQNGFAFAYKEITSSEANPVFTPDTGSQRTGATVQKINGAEVVATQAPESSVANGTTTNPDPPNQVVGDSKDYLFITLGGTADGRNGFTAAPSGYGNLNAHAAGGGGGGVTGASAERTATTGADENPGAFTNSRNDDWGACTIVIHPAGVSAQTITLTAGVAAASAVPTPQADHTVFAGTTPAVSAVPTPAANQSLVAVGQVAAVSAVPTPAANQSVRPTAVAAVSAVPAPTSIDPGPVSLTLIAGIAAVAGVFAPVMQQGLQPSPVVAVSAVPTPAANQSLLASPAIAVSAVPTPVANQTVFATAAPAVSAVPTPAANQSVFVSPIGAVSSVQEPSEIRVVTTLSPTPAPAVSAVPTPQVNQTIFASPVAAASVATGSLTQNIKPDSAGDEQEWGLVGAATRWQALNDESDSSYVTSNGTSERELENMDALASNITGVTSVDIKARANKTEAANWDVQQRWKNTGTRNSANRNLTNGIVNYTQTNAINPATGNTTWPLADVNALQVGVEETTVILPISGEARAYEVSADVHATTTELVPGAVTISPSPVAAVSSVPGPVLQHVVSPGPIPAASSVQTPAANQSVIANAVPAVSSATQPQIDQTVYPGVTPAATAVPGPTVSIPGGSPQDITLTAGVAAVSSVTQPQIDQTIYPGVVAAVSAVPEPASVDPGPVSISPGPVSVVSSTLGPTMQHVVEPGTANSASSVQAPSVNHSLLASAVAAVSSAVTPQVNQTVYPAAASALSSAVTPQADQTIYAGIASAVSSAVGPTVSIPGPGGDIDAPPVVAVSSVVAPAVFQHEPAFVQGTVRLSDTKTSKNRLSDTTVVLLRQGE